MPHKFWFFFAYYAKFKYMRISKYKKTEESE